MMKKLTAGLSLALMWTPVMAETGFYAGATAGHGTFKETIAGFEFKGSDTGFKLFGGYRFNEYGSLEVSYNDGATPSDTVAGVTIETDASAIQASALWQVPVTDRFEFFLRLSAISWEAENTATDGRFSITVENEGTDFGLGFGAGVFVTPKFGLRAEYEGADFDGTEVRLFSLSGLFIF